ncbi:hypothetical protein ACFVYC_10720 [Pseudarthrobacter sp. NPDC058329]|uniref:hypothetical protein n=1 Tax=Pseudarthrobacter sp. NPDC058329 TaxID=3346448 RepID=UPI0036DBDD2C
MDEVTTGIRPSGESDGHNGHLKAEVDVYFPDEMPGVVYVRYAGTWFRYERSGSAADIPEAFNAGNGGVHKPAPESTSLHWAGHQDGSSLELVRERKPRVYYDPYKHPNLFVTGNGGPPRAPLPVLEMNAHLEDPKPWLDPATGKRFTCDQARIPTAILKYAPRKDPCERLQGTQAVDELIQAIIAAPPAGGIGADAPRAPRRRRVPVR